MVCLSAKDAGECSFLAGQTEILDNNRSLLYRENGYGVGSLYRVWEFNCLLPRRIQRLEIRMQAELVAQLCPTPEIPWTV